MSIQTHDPSATNGAATNGVATLPMPKASSVTAAFVPVASDEPIPPVSTETQASWHVVHLNVKHIVPSPFQPRQHFDESELGELAQSVRAYGVQQPVLVRPLPSEGKSSKPRYELVAGERRLRATKLAGRKTVPALVRELSDLAAAEIAVIENVQRSNLSVIEEARGYKQLALKFRLKEERIAKKVGKSVHTIKEMLRLLQLPESVQALLARRQLSAAHGHELLKLAAHPRICESVALRAVRDKLTATVLASNVLPNAQELKRSGLIAEVGFGTKFDWRSVCKACPHKALVSSGYQSYCLRPDQWKRKQDDAIEIQKQEASRVMEEARQQHGGTVEAEKLSSVSHRRLLHVQLPAGCSERCECRSETFDEADPMRRLPICLNPDRFEELRDAERAAHETARKERYTREWNEAVTRLQNQENGASVTAALVVWPILRAEYQGYVSPDVWRNFVQQIASHLQIELLWEELLDRHSEPLDGLKRLCKLPASQLLLLGAAILLGQEAQRAIRFPGEMPQLDFALGREKAVQTEIEADQQDEDDSERDGDGSEFEYEDYSGEDYSEVIESEAEVEEDFGASPDPQPETVEVAA